MCHNVSVAWEQFTHQASDVLSNYSEPSEVTPVPPSLPLICTQTHLCTRTCILVHTHTHASPCESPPQKKQKTERKPRNPQVGAVQLDALTNLFGANCQWETSARTAVDKTGCWGEQIPLHEGGGQWGANVLMCGRWLGRDNGRISQSSGWLIWDGSSQPLTVGSPIVPLLIPTSHKLQTKVNLFLKGRGEISTRVSAGESDSKNVFARDVWLSNSMSLSSPPASFWCALCIAWCCCGCWIAGCWMIPVFQTRVGQGHLLEA